MSRNEAGDRRQQPEDSAELLHRSLALKAFPPLHALDERVLSTLARLAQVRQVGTGNELPTSNREARTLRLVVSGTLVDPRSGARFGPRELAGGPDAFTLHAPTTTLVAESRVVLLEFEERVLEALFEDEFSVLEALLRGLGQVLLERGVRHLELPGKTFDRPMGLVERVQLLRACPALGTLGIDILADLGIEGDLVRLSAGQSWSLEANCYATLLSGELSDDDSAPMRAPSFFGWLEVLADRSVDRRFVARHPSAVMSFDGERLWDRLEDYPEQGLAMVRALGSMLRAR